MNGKKQDKKYINQLVIGQNLEENGQKPNENFWAIKDKKVHKIY